MNTRLASFFALAAFSAAVVVQPAIATPVVFCSNGPGGDATSSINLVTEGCVSGSSTGYPNGGDGFYSNAGGGDDEAAVEQALFHATNQNIDLDLYGKSDDNPSLFSFNPSDLVNSQSGTFSVLDQTLIYYITVKAANSFALYELAPPSDAGSYSTVGLLTPNGNSQPTVSHISFWTRSADPNTAIPEPTSVLLLGAGSLAALYRRKKKA